jgi:CO/xanthine dehydrogenase Mo-binding subunit
VTGRARYGADISAPGMLHAAVVRSPHAHARIASIDASKALALDGVKAVVTRADLPTGLTGEDWNLQENTLAGEVALYDGHAVAAVAATSKLIAQEAARLIEVDYEVLPHVTDVDAAMAAGAPVIRPGRGLFGAGRACTEQRRQADASSATATWRRALPPPTWCASDLQDRGDAPGLYRAACLPGPVGRRWRGEMWVCTQGHWYIRRMCAAVLGIEAANLRVTPSEIGGGFGGKTTIFMEPLALALSKKAGGRPVKLVMSRDEVLRATGPTASASMDVKLGMKKDGTITAGRCSSACRAGPSRHRRPSARRCLRLCLLRHPGAEA